jgi:hypothetical protein
MQTDGKMEGHDEENGAFRDSADEFKKETQL